jgi:hypothetical protein
MEEVLGGSERDLNDLVNNIEQQLLKQGFALNVDPRAILDEISKINA